MKTDPDREPDNGTADVVGRPQRISVMHDRIAGRIRCARLAAKFSQQLLSDRLGIDQAHLSRIESRKSRVSVDLLIDIAQVTGVTLDYLCFGNQVSNTRVLEWQPARELTLLWEGLDAEQQLAVMEILRLLQSSRRVNS